MHIRPLCDMDRENIDIILSTYKLVLPNTNIDMDEVLTTEGKSFWWDSSLKENTKLITGVFKYGVLIKRTERNTTIVDILNSIPAIITAIRYLDKKKKNIIKSMIFKTALLDLETPEMKEISILFNGVRRSYIFYQSYMSETDPSKRYSLDYGRYLFGTNAWDYAISLYNRLSDE